MIRGEKLHALILSRRNVGEADRLVTLLTHRRGLLRVLAKGVRRVPSKRGGHLEPMTAVIAFVSGRDGRYFLSAVETVNYYTSLHTDRDALMRAQVMAYVVSSLFEEEPQPRLFKALLRAWELLPALPMLRQSLLEAVVVLLILKEAGLLPLLTSCQRCGAKDPARQVVLDALRGGWLCQACYPAGVRDAVLISDRVLTVLRYISAQSGQALQLRITQEESSSLVAALRSYVADLTGRSRDWPIEHRSLQLEDA